jgi:putative protease
VYSVEQHGEEAALSFARGALDVHRVQVGDRVWKTSDPELEGRLRQSFGGAQPRYQRPIRLAVRGRAGEPLSLVAGDELGHTVRLDSAMPLVRAERQPVTTERLGEQLGRLGGTPFKLAALDNQLQGNVLLPVGELNRLRREAVARLEELRAQPRRWTINREGPAISHLPGSASLPAVPRPAPAFPQLVVLTRSLAQLEVALHCQAQIIYWESRDASQYGQAVRHFRACQSKIENQKSKIYLAPPRITKPGEEPLLERLRATGSDGFVARNYDHLESFSGRPCVGDFSLNVANQLSAEYFVSRHGLERITASLDLDDGQLEALLQAVPPEWIEVVVHTRVPMFHIQHCVYCALLSVGTDSTNCGRPCERHTVKLRDRMGAEHLVRADAACRNTVFNGLAQTRAEHVARLMSLGARWFRVELLDETAQEAERILEWYGRLLRGEATGKQLRQELGLRQRLGFTSNPNL